MKHPRPHETVLSLYDEIPDLQGHPRSLIVTTDDAEGCVGRASWPKGARATVNRLAADERGRAIFCRSVEMDEVLAALGFSLDGLKSQPVLAYAFALRREPELAAASRGAAWVLKLYLHHIGAVLGRGGGEILFRAPPGDAARYARDRLGFETAPRYRSIGAGGELLVQYPP